MNTVLRREEKYLIRYNEAARLKNMFETLLETDTYSKDRDYTVRSLYFDTIDDKDFFDKINEQNLRRKIRLRIYNPSDATAKLELKQKENVYQKKRFIYISKQDAKELINGNISVLLNYKNDFADEVYGIMSTECYRAKTIVEYKRKAFIAKENSIRLTFDSDMRATESSLDLFDENLILNSIFDSENVIFEVKYDKFMLGYISDIISNVDRRTTSFSKYTYGRSIGYPLYL